MGRLTRDPEMSQTQNGVSVVKFSIAVPRRFQKDATDFINCVAWRQTADFICKYFNKGSMIAVVGSIQTRNWEDAEGKKHYATEVIADEVYFAGSKGNNQTEQTEETTSSLSDELPDFPDVFPDDVSDDLPF